MHDRSVAKLALLMACAGLTGLFLVNLLMVPMAVAIADVDESRLGEIVKVSGKVRRAVVSEGSVFLTIWDGSNEIKAIVWQSVARGTEVYELRPGDRIAVTGQVAVYRGELEIVASKVEVEQ